MRSRHYFFLKKRITSYSLDDFGSHPATTQIHNSNEPALMIKAGDERDLLYYADPICPVCNSSNVRRNGTFPRRLENRTVVNIQRYICRDCGNSFGAGPPSHGYWKHYFTDIRHKSLKGRVKTSLRKTASLFLDLLSVPISHETVSMNVPLLLHRIMDS